MKGRVLLVHGLWMHAPALLFWKRQLSKAGYDTEFFSYPSLFHSPENALQRLRDLALAQPQTHVLAHSLGGLLAVKALTDTPEFTGKIICVGTPLKGSKVANQLPSYHLGKLVGHSLPLLSAGLTCIPNGLHVSVIAGVKPLGLGRLVHHFNEPNDGTVGLSETQLPGLAQHVQVNASHSGQLVSHEVMHKVLALLESQESAS